MSTEPPEPASMAGQASTFLVQKSGLKIKSRSLFENRWPGPSLRPTVLTTSSLLFSRIHVQFDLLIFGNQLVGTCKQGAQALLGCCSLVGFFKLRPGRGTCEGIHRAVLQKTILKKP